VRTDQLRCTSEETGAFFDEVMGIQLPDETTQEIWSRTEGWLVGLQLLGLSLPERVDPLTLLEEISGEQRYILDFLTEVVLQRQPQNIQTFLLSTSILGRLSASLCDAVMQQTSSQQMLQRLEQANLFVVSLDSKREWYRYHALFAEALHYRLEQRQADLVPILHHRASRWYAEHNQTTEAILHAFRAKEWQWAADLIESKSLLLISLTWGVSDHLLGTLQHWLRQMPTEIIGSRPRLCLACTHMLSMVAPYPMLEAWLKAAEASLTASLDTQTSEQAFPPMLALQERQEQQNLLGEILAWYAMLQSLWEDYGREALLLCQRALALLLPENVLARTQIAAAQLTASFVSSANDAVAAVEYGLQASSLVQAALSPALAIAVLGNTACFMIGAGRLDEAQRLIQQTIHIGRKPEGPQLPEVGWPALFQAEILREWNQLDAAYTLAKEALAQCQQAQAFTSLVYVVCGYAVLLRIALSCGDLDAAYSAFQNLERTSARMNPPISLHFCSLFTTIDQVRLQLACGELDRATRWAEELDLKERHGTPFAREREEVARARIFLARKLPNLALQQLEPVLQRATESQRWGHVIEMRLLQALALQMLQEEPQSLGVLSEAVRLAEPEGYIRSFVDEGPPMAALLSKLRDEQCKQGPNPYLDRLLAAFPKPYKAQKRLPKWRKQERLL
jgi:LuxR family maltose regulon positive regulatory protein